jgi:hypothetical protein
MSIGSPPNMVSRSADRPGAYAVRPVAMHSGLLPLARRIGPCV